MGIIVRTLYHVGPPVAHLVVVLVVLGLMFSAMAHLVLGTYVAPLSTLSGAVSDTFTLFVGHSVVEDVDTIRPRDQLLAPAQVGLLKAVAGLELLEYFRDVRERLAHHAISNIQYAINNIQYAINNI